MNKFFKRWNKEIENSGSQASAELPQNPSKITLLTTTEGGIFIAGIVIALLYTIWLGAKFLFNPDKAQMLAAITAFEILFGRAAGMALGYSLQFGHRTVIPICIVLETVLVLIFYPLFVFSWRHLVVIKSLKNFFDRIQKAAVTHQDKVRKYGIIGLFAFVWFPFWMTGPMVGCVIGFLMALPAWLNLSVVLSGTYIAIFCWAFVLHAFHQKVAEDSPFAAMILMLIIVLVVILGVFLSKVRQERYKNSTKL
ncbi:MAG: small multi-drug export protein [Sedimentisphaerales bacterium]|nr:small multi-drug export protein [Sedimentisphaerales bacterium]